MSLGIKLWRNLVLYCLISFLVIVFIHMIILTLVNKLVCEIGSCELIRMNKWIYWHMIGLWSQRKLKIRWSRDSLILKILYAITLRSLLKFSRIESLMILISKCLRVNEATWKCRVGWHRVSDSLLLLNRKNIYYF